VLAVFKTEFPWAGLCLSAFPVVPYSRKLAPSKAPGRTPGLNVFPPDPLGQICHQSHCETDWHVFVKRQEEAMQLSCPSVCPSVCGSALHIKTRFRPIIASITVMNLPNSFCFYMLPFPCKSKNGVWWGRMLNVWGIPSKIVSKINSHGEFQHAKPLIIYLILFLWGKILFIFAQIHDSRRDLIKRQLTDIPSN
jgi:hypothetical protein